MTKPQRHWAVMVIPTPGAEVEEAEVKAATEREAREMAHAEALALYGRKARIAASNGAQMVPRIAPEPCPIVAAVRALYNRVGPGRFPPTPPPSDMAWRDTRGDERWSRVVTDRRARGSRDSVTLEALVGYQTLDEDVGPTYGRCGQIPVRVHDPGPVLGPPVRGRGTNARFQGE